MRYSNVGKSRSKKIAEKAIARQSNKGENAKPVKAGNSGFSKSAERVNAANRMTPMRGGIRF